MAEQRYGKSTYDLNNSEWVPVIAPINCNGFALKSTSGTTFSIRTTVDDANTEDVVDAGMQEVVNPGSANVAVKLGLNFRFVRGSTICYGKSSVAHDQVIGTFVW